MPGYMPQLLRFFLPELIRVVWLHRITGIKGSALTGDARFEACEYLLYYMAIPSGLRESAENGL